MQNININFDKKEIILKNGSKLSIHSSEGFEIIKKLWEYTNWSNKYSYNFTWFGRPIIQLPDDMIRIQEIIVKVKPTVIIETGIAHGGSLIYYSSILKLLNGGRVIGIDIDIRKHNKQAIQEHPFYSNITLVEGSSIDKHTINSVRTYLDTSDIILVILDSCHTKEHVLEELNHYSQFVTKNSYIIVADGIMKDVVDAPNAQVDWEWNNPQEAIKEFLIENKNFTNDDWNPLFKESNIYSIASYYPNGFLRRIL